MQLDILKRIVQNSPKEQWLELYTVSTGESVSQEDIDKAVAKPKKQSILTVEKELLNSYCEAVADLKRVWNAMRNAESETDAWNKATDLLEEFIAKHTQRISDSEIWQ